MSATNEAAVASGMLPSAIAGAITSAVKTSSAMISALEA